MASKNTDQSEAVFLPARRVWERYGVSDMTIWRWLHDPESNFPQPIYLGRYRYWRIADLEIWEREQARKSEDAPKVAPGRQSAAA